MTVAAAHSFIEQVRRDTRLRDRIAALGEDPDLNAVLAIAESEGARFTLQALRRAFDHNWMLCRLAGASANGASTAGN